MSWFAFNLRDFSVSFLSILFEGVPFLFLGTFLSGIIDAFVPTEAMERLLPRNAFAAIVLSALLGILFPMCECGVVPVIRRLIRKGFPVSCALTYLLAAPIVNPIVGLSTFAAFRGQHPATVTSLRLSLGFAVAIACGLIVRGIPVAHVLNARMLALLPGRRAFSMTRQPELAAAEMAGLHEEASAPGFGQKMLGAIRCTAFDFLDVGFYLVLGAAVASVFNTAVRKEALLPFAANPLAATGGMMLLALLLSLCSTSDAFIAASFLGFPLAAKLAFMVFGPMMDMKLLFMYGLVFRKRFTFSFAAGLFLLIGTLCLCLGNL